MAAGSTYTPIATTTLGSAAASVTLSSISTAYTDLIVIVNTYLSANAYSYMQVGNNGLDAGTNLSVTWLYGYGNSTSGSIRQSNTATPFFDWQGNDQGFGTAIINFQNYANTSVYKTFLFKDASTNTHGELDVGVGLWRSTSALNTIKFTAAGTTFVAGSTFTVYGIQAA